MWEILNVLQQKFTITSIDSGTQTFKSDFLGDPVMKNPPANAGDMGWNFPLSIFRSQLTVGN